MLIAQTTPTDEVIFKPPLGSALVAVAASLLVVLEPLSEAKGSVVSGALVVSADACPVVEVEVEVIFPSEDQAR
ncbi:unnamed protein product [Fusarium graminearum]|nr:unnamed protein product [Fusarium graminearum]CAG1991583.1 unnamed protein product [Fusarium graminearum]VTO85795.1 unnamed protein product [Fusarium graminearum]